MAGRVYVYDGTLLQQPQTRTMVVSSRLDLYDQKLYVGRFFEAELMNMNPSTPTWSAARHWQAGN